MALINILVFLLLAILIGSLRHQRQRSWILLISSIMAVFWLQPGTTLRHFNFWLPMGSLVLTVMGWFVIAPTTRRITRADAAALAVIFLIPLIIGLMRALPAQFQITKSYPPQLHLIVIACLICLMLITLLYWVGRWSWISSAIFTCLLLSLFIFLKSENLSNWLSGRLRILTGQSSSLAGGTDLQWLGFSYLAFRLLHTIRDRWTGRLPPVNLREFVTYTLFFPSLTAGPIDRVERFIQDLRNPQSMSAERALSAGKRISIGLLKKFVLADSLSILALDPTFVDQVSSPGWLWVFLYAYAFQIYLDFGGYTDVAIGVGMLMGIDLPENFIRPYLQTNIGEFWNRWHMTLAQWFRFYFFNPLTRFLRSSFRSVPAWCVIMLGQVTTMALIGLWHGITWNFLVWGLWHGAGLFVHNRWVALLKRAPTCLEPFRGSQALRAMSILATFHYVVLGWVWFAMPDLQSAWSALLTLIGV